MPGTVLGSSAPATKAQTLRLTVQWGGTSLESQKWERLFITCSPPAGRGLEGWPPQGPQLTPPPLLPVQPPLLRHKSPEPSTPRLSTPGQKPGSGKLGKATISTWQLLATPRLYQLLLPPPNFVLDTFYSFSYSLRPSRAGTTEAYLDSPRRARAYQVPG